MKTWAALGLGLLPVLSLFVDVGLWLTFVLGLLASAGARWLMPERPVRAGVLAYGMRRGAAGTPLLPARQVTAAWCHKRSPPNFGSAWSPTSQRDAPAPGEG